MGMSNGRWDGLYMRGHAPDHITWQNWNKDLNREPVPEDWGWSKFGEIDRGACKYAGYENDAYGEESILYLRFSLKSGEVTGVKESIDTLDAVSGHWNDYDTPKGATRGPNYIRYIHPLRIIEEES